MRFIGAFNSRDDLKPIIMCETTHLNMKKIELLVCIYEIPRDLVFIYGISGHSGWSSPFGSLHVLQQGTIKQMF